eukprot:SAG22_NODE_709_length_7742_cov_2.383488_7_plen_118_part_00
MLGHYLTAMRRHLQHKLALETGQLLPHFRVVAQHDIPTSQLNGYRIHEASHSIRQTVQLVSHIEQIVRSRGRMRHPTGRNSQRRILLPQSAPDKERPFRQLVLDRLSRDDAPKDCHT